MPEPYTQDIGAGSGPTIMFAGISDAKRIPLNWVVVRAHPSRKNNFPVPDQGGRGTRNPGVLHRTCPARAVGPSLMKS